MENIKLLKNMIFAITIYSLNAKEHSAVWREKNYYNL